MLATWTPLVNPAPPGGTGTMELLSDGTVIMQQGGVSKNWIKLTPDANGSYVNGTWSTIAPMGLERLYTATKTLQDGRIFVLGGEYTGPNGTQNFANSGEIYDPVANTWTPIPNFPRSAFGDDPSAMLPDGRVLCGYISGPQTFIYSPFTNSWSQGPTKLNNDRSDEETWVKLPDDSILSYNVFSPQTAQRFDPALNQWIDSGTVPVQLETTAGKELGPAHLLPDGRVVFIGGTNHNAIYTPSAIPGGTGSWAALPDTPGGIGANDAPGCMMPNGHILYVAGDISTNFRPPSEMFEFDPIANTITKVTPAIINLNVSAYVTRMLMLPSGQVLFTNGGNQLFVYDCDGGPQPSWAPTISTITSNGNNNFTLTGTQLNGISEGASYGDDAEMSTNYPIIRLKDANGLVTYARTFNWSSTGVATGSKIVSTQFNLANGMPTGPFSIAVVANGISSVELQNQTATDITLSSNSVAENTSTATPLTIGNLAVVDDGLGVNTLSITSGFDAAKFQLQGNQLQFKAGTVLDYETKNSYKVNITTSDGSLTFTKTFTISITDVNEAPTSIQLPNNSLPENVGAANPLVVPLDVDTIIVADDALGTNVLSIGGPDAAFFQLTGNKLQFKAGTVLDFESPFKTYSITLTVDDASGPFSLTKSFTVNLTDVDEVPTDLTLSNNTLAENTSTANPLTVGLLTITDDALGTNVLSVGGIDGNKFQITGNNTLQFKAGTVLDFETQSTYSVDVISTDSTVVGSPLVFTKTFLVQLTDVNEAAVNITVTPNVIPEVPGSPPPPNPAPVTVGTVNVLNDAIGSSALVPTLGGPDAASFVLTNVVGTTGLLSFAAGVRLDRETKDTYYVDFTAVDIPTTSIQSVKRVAITLSNVNETPTAVVDYMTLAEGGTATSLVGGAVSVLANDTDPDFYGNLDTLNVTSHSSPLHGLLTLNPNGTFSYQHDDSENLTDSFTYTVTDIGGLTSSTTVNILITPVNDNAPIAVTDPVFVNEGATVTSVGGGASSLLANDIDLDLPNDTLTFDTTPVTPVIHGTLQLFANGTFQYTHDGSETTSDSFQYRIHDALNRQSIGTVSITVNPVNDNPISRPDTIEVAEGGSVSLLLNAANSVLANDSDAESPNSALITTVAVQPLHGTLTLNPNGTFSYQHDGSETQTDSFTYQVTDPQNGSSQAVVSIRILPVNDSTPVAVNDNAEVQQGSTVFSLIGGATSVVKNDTDADLPFDSLTVTPMSSPTHGTLTLSPNGSFYYTHDGTKSATDSFTYKVTDAVGHISNTATVNISIKLINERPVANAGGPYMLAPGTDLVLNGAGSSDPDGDSLTYRWDIKGDGIVDATTSSPTIPWATLVSLGVITGVTTVNLEVRDPSGLSASASTSLQIGNTYQFTATADGSPDEYVVSTINGAIDIRKVGTVTNLAPAGLTAVTTVNIVGSADNETFLVQSPSRTIGFFVDGNGGTDIVKVQGTAQADTFNVLSPNGRIIVQKMTTVGFYVSATAETIAVLGNDGADTLDARQVLMPLTLLQLLGENGNDTLTGGLGNDAFIGGDGTDLLAEVGPDNLTLTDTQLTGHGTDSIDATIEAIKLTGDAGGNLFDASAFTRFGVQLDGAAGDDTLLGGSKTDSLIGGDGMDEVRQAVLSNATLTNTLLTLGIAPNTVSDGLSSIERVKLTGSGTVNKLDATNFSGSTTLDGGAAADTLIGGSGADLILGGSENDSLQGNGGNDTIGGGTGNDLIDGGDGNDGLAGQDGDDTIRGGTGNDTILGGAGNDSLRGGAGRDLIQGGAGKDNIDGEGDVDTVMGGSGGGPDFGDKIFDPLGEVNEAFRFTVPWLNLI